MRPYRKERQNYARRIYESRKKLFKKIIRTEKAATFLEFENVPLYQLKYKIDSVHVDFEGDKYKVAEDGVIKHPEDGYKVVYFVWEYQ